MVTYQDYHYNLIPIYIRSADNERAENSDGEVVKFNHPFFQVPSLVVFSSTKAYILSITLFEWIGYQANVMMLGESLCMLVYIIYWMAGWDENNTEMI